MEAAEFDQFYAAAAPRLVGQLTAMLGSLSEAQDCVQEAFVKAWLHRRDLDVADRPEAWVRRVAYNTGVSRWRQTTSRLRAHRRRGLDADAPAPNEDHAVLVAALARISPDQRRAIVLHHLCDLSVEEVAAEVGAPIGTVKARLSRGRAALADVLGPPSWAAGSAETGNRKDTTHEAGGGTARSLRVTDPHGEEAHHA